MTGAVVILPHGKVRRFRSLRRLEACMAHGEYLVVNIGRSDRAAVEECQTFWREVTRFAAAPAGTAV